MTHDDYPYDRPDHSPDTRPHPGPGVELEGCARQAEDAVRRLAHLSISRPSLTPAEIDTILGHLGETLAALPQVAAQLGDILDQARETYLLAVDGATTTTNPDLAVDMAIDTARLHLDELRGPAVLTYRHLNAARNETAHISATPLDNYAAPYRDTHDRHRRHQDHQPPPAAGPIRHPGPAR